jgi:vesicle coat complex subunit
MKTLLIILWSALLFSSKPLTDWSQLFRDTASGDPQRQKAAGELMEKIFDQISGADLAAILAVFKDPHEDARGQASGFLGTIAAIRRDSQTFLQPAVPVLLSQFRDRNALVRENAVLSVVSLHPQIPLECLDPLISLLHEDLRDAPGEHYRIQTAKNHALFGLARIAKEACSDKALNEFLAVIRRSPILETCLTAVSSIDQVHLDHPAVVPLLLEYLDAPGQDPEIIHRIVQMVPSFRSIKDSLKPSLERLAASQKYPDLIGEINSALAGIDRK